ncbi:MAG: hypothetical protein QW416_03505 [Candidatus Nitrosocaldaceae archaeon]
MKNYKINLPRIFKLANNEIIELESIYDVTFYLHTPNIKSVYNHMITKGFVLISYDEDYRLRKNIKEWIMNVIIHKDGFMEGYIGIDSKRVNTIYDLFDQYRDVYNSLHIYYKSFSQHGWIVEIMRYFRIELPQPHLTPWQPTIIKI